MIAIVGSRDLWPTPEVVAVVAAAIAAYPGPVGVRAGAATGVASGVEQAAVKLCEKWGKTCLQFQPEPGAGRKAVYERDYRLVEHADRVIAFFAPGNEMSGGTGHVVESALARGVEVEAYTIDEEGDVKLIGSDGDELRSNSLFLAAHLAARLMSPQ